MIESAIAMTGPEIESHAPAEFPTREQGWNRQEQLIEGSPIAVADAFEAARWNAARGKEGRAKPSRDNIIGETQPQPMHPESKEPFCNRVVKI